VCSILIKLGSVFVVVKAKASDQIGRVAAVFVFAPIIAYKGQKYQDNFLLGFSYVLFSWDLFWLICKKPVTF